MRVPVGMMNCYPHFTGTILHDDWFTFPLLEWSIYTCLLEMIGWPALLEFDWLMTCNDDQNDWTILLFGTIVISLALHGWLAYASSLEYWNNRLLYGLDCWIDWNIGTIDCCNDWMADWMDCCLPERTNSNGRNSKGTNSNKGQQDERRIDERTIRRAHNLIQPWIDM
jgi:hypothetical protein